MEWEDIAHNIKARDLRNSREERREVSHDGVCSQVRSESASGKERRRDELGPEQNWKASDTMHEHDCENTTPSQYEYGPP